MAYLWQGILALFVLEMITFALFITKIGFIIVFLLWLLSAVTGVYMMRHGGLTALMGLLTPKQGTQKPAIEGIFVFIAGLLFIFPGFISDFVALFVLMPFAQNILKPMTAHFQTQNPQSSRPKQDDNIIEGDFVVVEEPPSSLPPKSDQ